ncbi:LysR family transcriptional regulator [Serratia proteamaculans]|uniref:LysR family transcriptional regulator n=1 Tax=Serratia proteamaculans TaxID=28151 RepID=UPI001076073D|nr:LysR family transcriptional regulator [Serratia proteamaculans]TFZ52742.1 LysR family transcriptional regulator [Serratia proteamaculans]
MNIRENDFSRIDLNLLTVLMVLFRERSVSRAAEKLYLGQPAVSGALARLRDMFNDPLFIRTAQGMEPTPRAQALVLALTPLLEEMQQVLFQPPNFVAATAQHSFRIGMADWVEMWLMPVLMADLQQQAPGITLNVVATDPFQDSDALEQDRIDLAISVAPSGPKWLQREVLTKMRFCTLWHPGQLNLPTLLPLANYITNDHLLVSYRGANTSAIDEQLATHGLQRSVRYTSPHFATLPLILQRSPTLATVPAGLGKIWSQDYGLKRSELPLDLPPFEVAMLWHHKRSQDPALKWLMERIRALAAAAYLAG